MAPSTSLTVSVGAKTHIGPRSENQDRISRAETPFGDLYVVADGVGGYRGGGQAAQAVVDGFALHLKNNPQMPLQEVLQHAARTITADLRRQSEGTQGHSMVSTVVLAIVNGSEAVIAHAGDSRAYKLRNGKLERLTRDHSVVERLIDRGEITPEEAKSRPDAGVLTRAIGQESAAPLEVGRTDLKPGDALLLCSDGLWAFATNQDIQAIVATPSLSARGVADALLALALRGGGGDNVSLQFLKFETPEAAVGPPKPRLKGRQSMVLLTGVAAGLVLTAGLMAVRNNGREPRPEFKSEPPPKAASDAPRVTSPSADSSPPAGDNPAGHPPPAPPNSAPKAASPPASSPRGGEAKAPPAVRTPVTILTAESPDEPDWIRKLAGLPEVNAKRATASSSCAALGTKTPVLAATPAGLPAADALRKKLGMADNQLIQVAPEKLSACGGGDIFVLPAQLSFMDRGKKLIEKAKERFGATKKQ